MEQTALIAVYTAGTFLVVLMAVGVAYWQERKRRDN